jgi:two-component system phosphate regulon sensor histidine kinase PhoR
MVFNYLCKKLNENFMRNRVIILIIILSAISLVGLMITQAYWVTKAIELSEKHFEQRAYNALCD